MIGVRVRVDLADAKALAAAIDPGELEPLIMAGLRKGLRPVAERVRGRAPVGPTRASQLHLAGLLKRSVRARVRRGRFGIDASIRAVPYAHLVEGGHRVVRGGRVVGQARPHPFAGPVVEDSLEQVSAVVSQTVVQGLQFRARVRRVTR